jgi:hypothetical protein
LLRVVARVDVPPDRLAVIVLRVLGARHLAQTVFEVVGSQPAVRYLGVGVDALHGLTAVGLAVVDPRWRRGALIDTAIATSFAVATAVTVRATRSQ